jgi:hypothetical protein
MDTRNPWIRGIAECMASFVTEFVVWRGLWGYSKFAPIGWYGFGGGGISIDVGREVTEDELGMLIGSYFCLIGG